MTTGVTAKLATEALIEHWSMFGLPGYAQFDNDTRFQGAHQFKDSIGRVTRMCLSLGVIPVFAPPRETGFQAAIESLNARWQAKVWARFHYDSLAALKTQSDRYVVAHRARSSSRGDGAPPRGCFPKRWELNLQAPLRGKIIFLRRTTEHGEANVLGHTFEVDPNCPHRLVRAEVDLDAEGIAFYALRRRAPSEQPLLATRKYKFTMRRRFQG